MSMKHVITLLNSKSGSGKSTLAFNLAAVFAAEFGLKTGVLEYAKDVNDAEAEYGFNCSTTNNVEDTFFKPGGFYLMSAGIEGLEKAISAAAAALEILIIDTDAFPDDSVLEISDRILIPSQLVPIDVKYAQAAVKKVLTMKHPYSIVDIIANKSSGSLLSREDLTGIFGDINIAAVLPFEKGIPETAAEGGVYYLKKKKAGFSAGLLELGGKILSLTATKDHVSILKDCKKAGDTHRSLTPAAPENDVPKRVSDPHLDLKREINSKLFKEIDIRNLEKDALSHPDKKSRIFADVKEKIRELLDKIDNSITAREERERVVNEIYDEVVGLGAVEDLLKDESITEVMVNRHDLIYLERKGKIYQSEKKFTDNASVIRAIERIVMPLGRRIDENQPYVDARLSDGSRVNAIIPPLAIDGPVITIRKFSSKKLTIKDLIGYASISAEAAEYLQHAVVDRKNILISGGTGSGKTTLLNVMSSFIPEDERIVTIEDSAELRLPQEHVVRLESRPANIEGKGEVTIRDLVRNSLRMRPDRIVVGECRGGETLDMLQAMNTGHEGSMTTIHANTPRDALSRIEVMVLMAGVELPLRAIREQIKSAIDVIIQQSRMKDGSRKVTYISEVTGMEGDTILMHNVFEFVNEGTGADGSVNGKLKKV
jgi:Flp pilus assembly CpaF family ATPase